MPPKRKSAAGGKKLKAGPVPQKPLASISEIQDIDIFSDLKTRDPTRSQLIQALEEAAESSPDVLHKAFLQLLLHAAGLQALVFKTSEVNIDTFDLESFFEENLYKHLDLFQQHYQCPLEAKLPEFRLFVEHFQKFWGLVFSDQCQIVSSPDSVLFDKLFAWGLELSR